MPALPLLEKTKFWREPDLGNLELLQATYVTHAFTRHTHDTYAIGVIVRGAEQFEYRRQNYQAPAGSVVLVNPAEVHTGQSVTAEGWTYRMLYPDPALLQKAASQVTGRAQDLPFFPTPIVKDDPLARRLLDLHRALEQPLTTLERESHLLDVLGLLVLRQADAKLHLAPLGQEPQAVRRAREFLEAHYAENLRLEELAAISHLSPFHLLRVFRQTLGLPPHAYQTQLRIARAKTLLSQNKPLVEVAFETGFVDQSHLTRQFKRIVGVSPGQYRFNRNNIQDTLFLSR